MGRTSMRLAPLPPIHFLFPSGPYPSFLDAETVSFHFVLLSELEARPWAIVNAVSVARGGVEASPMEFRYLAAALPTTFRSHCWFTVSRFQPRKFH